MADSFIQLPVDGVGKLLNTSQKTVGANTVQSERHVITDNVNNNYANVSAAGAVQVDGSAVVQPVSGTLTTTPPANASTNITQVGGSALTEGQKVMASSVPVVIASDQSAVPVSGTVSVSNFPATQPVSGSVSVSNFPATQPISATSLPLPTGASTAAKQPALGTAGAPSADVITVQGVTSMTPIKTDGSAVVQPVSGTVAVSNFPATQPVSGTVTVTGTVTSNQGTANTAANAWPVKPTDGTNVITVKAASTASVATDTSEVIQISPNQPQLTTPLNIQGSKTNNNAAPGANNLGTLPSLANAATPTWTEGDQVNQSVDLGGALRTVARPSQALGYYSIGTQTGIYSGLTAGSPLFSMRWTDATRLCLILKVSVSVVETTVATADGQVDRQLIIARGFTASDSGGTAIVLTGNNQKHRTSMATSLVGDMRIATTAALTAGTRTLDGVGMGIAAATTGTGPVTAGVVTTIIPKTDLFSAFTGPIIYPIVLAQNEGIIIRMVTAEPGGSSLVTYVDVAWAEVNSY